MPNYHFKEIWTPLSFVRIKLFRDDEGHMWIKTWRNHRRRLRK